MKQLDSGCKGNYYRQQQLTLAWATSANVSSALPVNKTAAAVAGHSMGGQASLFNAADYEGGVGKHHIKAAALHHAFTHTFPAYSIPTLTFTGTLDDVATPASAKQIFDTPGGTPIRGLVNKKGADHHEPSTHYNPQLALYTVAWFKLYVDGTPQSQGRDWDALIHGSGTDSICGGGDGKRKECSILGGTPS